ncbi:MULTISPECIES: DNA cytosine methyltransferase [Saccharibacillus]|uniref:DNA cytosine methyltransferase n=1 Tax=Saccharibacillus TaxID=456492 RepID=UPI001238FA48|nr:DNA cytosine methyltransferase [Saccharibacillus sp. WB 17]MWJ30917.1 DNA (cytosine-5-)-methyltransferase [Saccharibacillus sp. WB 17]
MNIIDLFSGAGGLTEGFHQHGHNIIAQVEKDPWACETLRTRSIYYFLKGQNDLQMYYYYLNEATNYRNIEANREIIYKKYPDLKPLLDRGILNKKFGAPHIDQEATAINEIINSIHEALLYKQINEVDLIIGGPPCQSFSLVGRGRMREAVRNDPRNMLFLYYKDIVNEFRPRAFIFENVPGILNAQKGAVFSQIQSEFNEIGYTLKSGISENHTKNIIDFADYGVFQHRKRVLLFGYRNDHALAYPDFSGVKRQWSAPVNTLSAISDLTTLKPGEGEDLKVTNYAEDTKLNDYQKFMREDSIGIINHKARSLLKTDQEIYRIAIRAAENGIQLDYRNLPDTLRTHRNQTSFLDRFKVHRANDIPHTVVAHISKDGHYNIHPDILQSRSFTVREAARIQGFPDNFRFEGPRTAQYVQVGNAVPPLMSEVIAKSMGYLF